MPRRARLSLANVAVHIIQRGNNRAVCFYAEEDYRCYLDHLAELAKRYGCLIHAYVLMTNHVHLLLTPQSIESTGLMMKHLGQRYVQYINRSYRRSGTLWEGRYRSCLVQSEGYLLECYRYIELNPVRAGMVAHPHDYRWSSYHANGDGKRDLLVTPHVEYDGLGTSGHERRKNYRALFAAHMEPALLSEIRMATNGNYVLGNSRYQEEIARVLKRRVVRGVSGRPKSSAGSDADQLDLL